MPYSYTAERPALLTDKGQRILLNVALKLQRSLAASPFVRAEAVMRLAGQQMGCSSSWEQLAVVDRLVELGALWEIRQAGEVAAQHRLFKRGAMLS